MKAYKPVFFNSVMFPKVNNAIAFYAMELVRIVEAMLKKNSNVC